MINPLIFKMTPKHLVFKVTKQKALDFSFLSASEMQKYPVFEHYLTEVQELIIVYKYKAPESLDIENYIKLLSRKLKRKYNAYSVVFLGSKVQDEKLTS